MKLSVSIAARVVGDALASPATTPEYGDRPRCRLPVERPRRFPYQAGSERNQRIGHHDQDRSVKHRADQQAENASRVDEIAESP
jgi:hypothetical protein